MVGWPFYHAKNSTRISSLRLILSAIILRPVDLAEECFMILKQHDFWNSNGQFDYGSYKFILNSSNGEVTAILFSQWLIYKLHWPAQLITCTRFVKLIVHTDVCKRINIFNFIYFHSCSVIAIWRLLWSLPWRLEPNCGFASSLQCYHP